MIGREGYDAMHADGTALRGALPFVDGGSVVPPRRLGCGLADFELIVAGLGELLEELTTGFAPDGLLRRSSRRPEEIARRPIGFSRRSSASRRRGGRVSDNLTPLTVSTLLLRDDVAAARERLDRLYLTEARCNNLPLVKLAEADLLIREERWAEAVRVSDEMRELHEQSGALYLPPAADRLAGRASIGRGAVAEGLRLLDDGCIRL